VRGGIIAMSKLKSAIIGFGSIAQTHVEALKEGNVSKVVAVCDINPDKLESVKEACPGAKAYTDYAKLLDDRLADVIHICTPHYLHMPITVKALQTGHDVYLEKPAGMNTAEIERIIDESEKYGRKVCVSFQNRVIPSNWAAKCILESGELGAIKALKGIVTWHREGEYYTESGWRGSWSKEGGGVLMNQSIHTLDLMCFLGGPINNVNGTASLRKNRGTIEVEDTAEATLYYENGAVGIFYATNCYISDSPIELEVVCENGSLLIRDDMLYKNVNSEIEKITENSKAIVGKSCWGVGHQIMIWNFYSVLQGGTEYYCDIRDALPSMKAIEGIYASYSDTLVNRPF
jgi:UDP-N-acetyl-2-amino-2-deoxyglucuronate dehydrogenase